MREPFHIIADSPNEKKADSTPPKKAGLGYKRIPHPNSITAPEMDQNSTQLILLDTFSTIMAVRVQSLIGSSAPPLFPDPEYPLELWVGKRNLISNSD